MMCSDRTIIGRDTTFCKSGIWGCKQNQNIEKIAFKVVHLCLWLCCIHSQKKVLYIYNRTFTRYLLET